MPKALRWKFALLAFLVVASVVLVIPSFYPNTPQWFKKYVYQEGLKLGLDLQGGMHLILKVDVDQAVRNAAELYSQDLKDALKRQNITVVKRKSENPDEIVLAIPNKSALEKIKEVIKEDFPNLQIKAINEEARFPTITLTLS